MDQHYRIRGFKHLRNILPVEQIDRLADLAYRSITPHRGKIRRQDGKMGFNEYIPYTTLVRNSVSDAHVTVPADLRSL